MWVTLSLLATTVTVVSVGAVLSVSRYRKLDDAPQSPGACFKCD